MCISKHSVVSALKTIVKTQSKVSVMLWDGFRACAESKTPCSRKNSTTRKANALLKQIYTRSDMYLNVTWLVLRTARGQMSLTSYTLSININKIGQFRYFKIQLKTIDIITRLWGINPTNSLVYSPEPRAEVYCLKLNIDISKLGYLHHSA